MPSAEGPPRRHVWLAAIVTAAGCLGLLALADAFAFHVDDAYITYRYAANLAAGEGFTYNPGDPVLGTTTPLYTLLLAAAAYLGLEVPTTSLLINALCGGLTFGLTFHWIARRTGRDLIGLIAMGLLLGSPHFLRFSISGMETSLYCLLILLAFVLYDSGALLAAAITAGLCVLLRLDGLAVGFVLAAHRIVTTRALPLPVIIGFCTTIAPWFLFALLYFGEVRPMSMLAKTHHEFVAERFWMLGHVFNLRMIPYWGLILGAVILSGWRIGWKRSPSYQLSSGTTALALWALAYATAYTVYRIDLYLWYVAPIDMAFAIFAALGAHSILKRTRLGLWVIVIVLAARGYYSGHVLYHSIPRDNAIESARHDIAATIRDRSKPGDAIATGAIGVLGWFTGAPIYDTLGLVTKDAIGKPFAAVLETCGARWLVSEVSSEGAAAPPMKGYSLVRRFVCNDRLVFLLYERE